MPVNYPFYKSPDLFVPSPAALKAWFSTRKTGNPFYPGVYDTIGFSGDLAWTFIAIFIELLATGVTLYGGAKISYMYAVISIIVVVLFIGLDIIGVMLHKSKQGDKCIHRNSAFVSKQPAVQDQHRADAAKLMPSELLGIILILFSAGLKIFGLMLFIGVSKSVGVTVVGLGTLFYVVVVYIHLNHTGYWISALSANRAISKEFIQWSKDLKDGVITATPQVITHTFTSSGKMNGPSTINSGRQVLACFPNADGAFQYTLATNGLLWDQDLLNLCGLLTDAVLVNDLKHEATRMQFMAAGVVLPS
jgi:hypothetical protein